MKVLLIVQREAGTPDIAWVTEAIDEYSLDEWNGKLPTALQAVKDADPENTRELWVEIPNDSLSRLWDVPTVPGRVVEP